MQAAMIVPGSADWRLKYDQTLLGLLVVLSAAGFVMMGSASMDYASEQFANPFFHIYRHGLYLLLGSLTLALTLIIPVRVWEAAGPALLIAGVVVLALVLVPGVGRKVNGATRWIALGPLNLQPSELMKLFFIVYLAGYMTRRGKELRGSWSGMLKPLGVLILVMALLLEVRRTPKDVQVILSRSHPQFVAKMFELEVPEVGEKIVEIKSIVREPGDRTKIAVSSRDKAVDPHRTRSQDRGHG